MISTLLREIMSSCNLRQADLAQVLGSSVDRVKGLTSGRIAKLSPDETRALVEKLHVRGDYLATGVGPTFQAQPPFAKHPGERLRLERERLGISPGDFAEIGAVSKHEQLEYEKGRLKPDAVYLERIARAGADVSYIHTGTPRALQDNLNDLRTANQVAHSVASNEVEATDLSVAMYVSRMNTRIDEEELLENYRRCAPPDQQVLKQMALRLARDAVRTTPIPGKSTKKKGSQR